MVKEVDFISNIDTGVSPIQNWCPVQASSEQHGSITPYFQVGEIASCLCVCSSSMLHFICNSSSPLLT